MMFIYPQLLMFFVIGSLRRFLVYVFVCVCADSDPISDKSSRAAGKDDIG